MTDTDKLFADAFAFATAKAAAAWAVAFHNEAHLTPEDRRNLAAVLRLCVRDLDAMAKEIARLRELVELLLSESPSRAVPCVDHPVLDVIAGRIGSEFVAFRPDCPGPAEDVRRERDSVEFRDPATGRRFEVIVRPIPDAEDRP